MTTKEIIIPIKAKFMVNPGNGGKPFNVGQINVTIKKAPIFIGFFYLAFKVFILGIRDLMKI